MVTKRKREAQDMETDIWSLPIEPIPISYVGTEETRRKAYESLMTAFKTLSFRSEAVEGDLLPGQSPYGTRDEWHER